MVESTPSATRLAARWARTSVLMRRRYSRLRHLVPASWARRYTTARSRATELRRVFAPVETRAGVDNIFHCTLHKSGSQWLISVLNDPIIYRYSGHTFFHTQRETGVDVRETVDRTFLRPFPGRTIVSPLYVTYPNFAAMPKAGSYRAFFVQRDPRDLIVSWYFSTRDNHIVDPFPENPLVEARATLRRLDGVESGLLYALDYWIDKGRFASLLSWHTQSATDQNVRLVRYEDLTGPDAFDEWRRLFDFLTVPLPGHELAALLEAYSFQRLSGRQPGQEDQRSHLRVGRGGDWRQQFTPRVSDEFRSKTGDLVTQLGYSWESVE